jgi:hypothetical protein
MKVVLIMFGGVFGLLLAYVVVRILSLAIFKSYFEEKKREKEN